MAEWIENGAVTKEDVPKVLHHPVFHLPPTSVEVGVEIAE